MNFNASRGGSQKAGLAGVIPVMLLPFNEDDSIDEPSLREQVDFVIARGANGVCAPGFATEFYKLTEEERRRVIRIVAEQTGGRVPMFASTGCGSVYATVELSRYAAAVGAQALMVTTPKWVTLSSRELALFFEGVCHNVELPVMVQDADFSGAGLPAALIVELAARCPNLKFAKLENTLAGGKCLDIVRGSSGKVQVLYGMGGIGLLDGLSHGASGVMPGSSFVEIYVRILELYGRGLLSDAKNLFYRLQPYLTFALQHLELVIQMDKQALVERGVFSSGRMRQPTLCLDEPYQTEINALIADMIRLCAEIKSGTTRRPDH